MLKMLLGLLLAVIGVAVLCGCSGGEVTVEDIQRNAKAQQDFIKAHPPKEDTHLE